MGPNPSEIPRALRSRKEIPGIPPLILLSLVFLTFFSRVSQVRLHSTSLDFFDQVSSGKTYSFTPVPSPGISGPLSFAFWQPTMFLVASASNHRNIVPTHFISKRVSTSLPSGLMSYPDLSP